MLGLKPAPRSSTQVRCKGPHSLRDSEYGPKTSQWAQGTGESSYQRAKRCCLVKNRYVRSQGEPQAALLAGTLPAPSHSYSLTWAQARPSLLCITVECHLQLPERSSVLPLIYLEPQGPACNASPAGVQQCMLGSADGPVHSCDQQVANVALEQAWGRCP